MLSSSGRELCEQLQWPGGAAALVGGHRKAAPVRSLWGACLLSLGDPSDLQCCQQGPQETHSHGAIPIRG